MAKRIMLIDDDSDDRELFREALSEIDPSIIAVTADSSSQAFDKLGAVDTGVFDLILLDINMPVVSGWECLKLLKHDQLYRNIPVVMFSTSSHSVERENARALGALGLITKPSNFEILKQRLQDVLEYLRDGGDSDAIRNFI